MLRIHEVARPRPVERGRADCIGPGTLGQHPPLWRNDPIDRSPPARPGANDWPGPPPILKRAFPGKSSWPAWPFVREVRAGLVSSEQWHQRMARGDLKRPADGVTDSVGRVDAQWVSARRRARWRLVRRRGAYERPGRSSGRQPPRRRTESARRARGRRPGKRRR